MKSKQRFFSIFSILLISFSTLFQPFTQIAHAASESDNESCDCIHMEKDVEGKATHEEDREKKFDFNLKFLIPKETAGQSKKVIVSDVVDNRLTVHSASVVTKDGVTVQGLNAVVNGQEVSLTLTNETKDKWNDKELHIKIVASINKEVADNEVIPNTFTIDLDGKAYTSNEVTVKAKSVPLTPIEPIETEMPKIKKDVEGKTSHEAWKNEKFTFNIKTTIPNNLNTYKGLTIVDDLDDKFQIDSTKVLVSGKESKFNASVKGQEVSLELTRDELNELKGKEVTIQIQVVQQMVYSDDRRYNTATVIVDSKNGDVEEDKTVESNRVQVSSPKASSIKTVEGNVELVNDWTREYKALNFTDEYTFVIKTQLPTLKQLGEGLVYFEFMDRIDSNLDVLSAEVFLDAVPYKDLASNFVSPYGVGQSFSKSKYEQMQGKEMTVKITVKAKDGVYPKEVKNQANISFKFEGTEFTNVGSGSNNVTVKYPDVQPKINKTVNGRTTQNLINEDEEFYFEIKGLVSDKYKVENKGTADKLKVVDNLDENFEVLSTELKIGNEVKDAAKYITLEGNKLTLNVEGNEINDFLNEEFVIKINAKLKDGYEGTSFSNKADLFLYNKGSSTNLGSNYVYVYPPKKEVPTPEPTPVSISVQKVWEGKKQNNVIVELFASGSKVNQVVLSDSNNWKHTFSKLDGSKTYTVKEVKVDGYETKITGNAKNGFVITNTEIVEPEPEPEEPKTDLPFVCECEVPTPPTPIEPATTSIDVEKVWKGEKQDEVTINLLADGEKVDSVVLNDANKWKHTFTDLPVVNKVTDEQAIVYTVEEVAIDGYEVSIAGNAKEGFTVTNTENVPVTPIEPATTSVDVEKVWKGEKQESVTINLLADGKRVDSIVLNDANAWKHTFTDLPVVNKVTDENAILYTVEEIAFDGYEVSIAGNAQTGFTVTNTENIPVTPIEPATTSVDVEKVWKGEKQESVTINLLADGKQVDSVVLNDANAWKHTFTDLPTVHAVTDEQAIVYTVEEVAIDGYEVSIAGNAQTGFTVTNTEDVPVTPIEPATTSVDVEKVWKGEKQYAVTINLLADGEKVDSVILNDANAWKHTFKDLPTVHAVSDEQAIVYTVEEVKIDGYEVSIAGNAQTGFTVTNTEVVEPEEPTVPVTPIEPATTSVNVEKVWKGKKQDAVTINLLADGKKIDSVILNDANKWKHTFENLLVTNNVKDEKSIVYTVEEVAIDGYEVSIAGSAKEGFTVTNTEITPEEPTVPVTPIEPATTKVSVEKVWELHTKEKQDVTIYLLADGKKVDSVILNDANEWKHTFENLLVTNNVKDEKSIVYTVEEVAIDGFETEITGNAKDGFFVTNKEVVPITPLEPSKPKQEEPKKDLPQMNTATKTLPIVIGLMMIVGAFFFLRSRKEQSNE